MVYYSMASYEDVLHTSGIHNSVLKELIVSELVED